jgi:hypothetical protein
MAALVANKAGVVLNGYAGEVPDFLTQSREAVIKSRLATVRRAYDGDGTERSSGFTALLR